MDGTRERADSVETMFGSFPQSRFMPCSGCGLSVDRSATDAHECDPEKVLDYQIFQLRDEIAAFDDQLAEWLSERE